ncbi:MAG: hypothetical protein DRI72_05010 [Bacteroidetes bacterium]|nr:MAG: hypothetical protein DRI72_05010 [Bacteroidota bacterium]RLD70586.1 MAG: hypothetical protein DRI87_08130 [Bacteroidota bacterium]
MKLIFWIIASLALIITISECKSTKKVTEDDATEKAVAQKITLYDKPFEDLKSDYFNIDSMAVENQTLAVFVSYGGGCGEVDFNMYYKPQMMAVMPHKSNLFLTLTDNDPCRSVVSEKLLFDLSVFNKEAKSGGVILNLNGKELRYQLSGEQAD